VSDYQPGQTEGGALGEFRSDDAESEVEDEAEGLRTAVEALGSVEKDADAPAYGISRSDRYLWRLQLLYVKLWLAMRVSVPAVFRRYRDVLEAGNEIQVLLE